jgi:hypothetical protein
MKVYQWEWIRGDEDEQWTRTCEYDSLNEAALSIGVDAVTLNNKIKRCRPLGLESRFFSYQPVVSEGMKVVSEMMTDGDTDEDWLDEPLP